jgi:hypothetical protein
MGGPVSGMSGDSVTFSHLEITFAVGTDLLILTPTAFDVNPARRDSGIVYCQVRFEAKCCKGGGGAVLIPEDFNYLRSKLALLLERESAIVNVCDMDGFFRLEGYWNSEHQLATFKATMPARIGPEDWSLRFKPSDYRDGMTACIELELWMKPDSLQEPVAATSAVLEHIRKLRAEYAARYGLDMDEECRIRHWQP